MKRTLDDLELTGHVPRAVGAATRGALYREQQRKLFFEAAQRKASPSPGEEWLRAQWKTHGLWTDSCRWWMPTDFWVPLYRDLSHGIIVDLALERGAVEYYEGRRGFLVCLTGAFDLARFEEIAELVKERRAK